MGEISQDAELAVAACQRVLSPQGRLSTAIPGFVAREPQMALSAEVARTIVEKSILVAEAGTGTGKTFAYLIPCLQSGKKAIISTATKTLQDQLFYKDVPLLLQALGLGLKVQNLKGRANYLCRYRLALHLDEGRFIDPKTIKDLLHVSEKLPQLRDGERSELPEIKEDSPVWPYVTSTVDNCLGNDCEHYQACFLTKARRRAMEASLVIINHHLFFADSRLKEEGFGELLPGADVIVFDEAHQLAELAANFMSTHVSTRQLRDVVDDLLREWPILDLANQPLKALSFETDEVIAALLQVVPATEERLPFDKFRRQLNFQQAWASLSAHLSKLLACFDPSQTDETAPGLMRCKERLLEIQALMSSFDTAKPELVLWIERFKQALVFHATPFHIAEEFNKLLSRQNCGYVFTSATLTTAGSFDCFTKPLGLERVVPLLLPSPFDYQQQALLYLPRGLPDPMDTRYYDVLIERARPLIDACGGRTFFLFTSHRALQLVAKRLRDCLNFPLLIQGEEAKPILLARFRQLGNAVLLGTGTFWEGVDVKGAALSCVIIDKLPFSSPHDPVVDGKMAYFKSQGLSGFDEYMLPEAVLALKQGVGRLIRDVSDRGVVMIADPRLTSRDYGRIIFESLPALKKTRDEQTVLAFINQLALDHEPTGN